MPGGPMTAVSRLQRLAEITSLIVKRLVESSPSEHRTVQCLEPKVWVGRTTRYSLKILQTLSGEKKIGVRLQLGMVRVALFWKSPPNDNVDCGTWLVRLKTYHHWPKWCKICMTIGQQISVNLLMRSVMWGKSPHKSRVGRSLDGNVVYTA